MQRERVAVCIAGSARTFRYNMTHGAILRHLVAPLRAHYHTDLFFLVRMADVTVDAAHPRAIEDDATTLRAIVRFRPVNITLLRDDLPTNRIRPGTLPRELAHYLAPETCALSATATVRVADTLYRSKQCLHAVRAREQLLSKSYHWVYRTRPDIILFQPVLLPSQLRRDTLYSNQGRPAVTEAVGLWWRKTRWSLWAGYGPIADQMAMASRQVADVALRAFDATELCDLYSIPGRVSPEEILRYWLMLHRVRYYAAPFDWAIVREFIGPECRRLFWQHGPGSDWKRSMARCLRFASHHQHLFPKSNFAEEMTDLQNMTRSLSDTFTW